MKKLLFTISLIAISFACSAQYKLRSDYSKNNHIVTINHPLIQDFLNDFYSKATSYKIDYEEGFTTLNSIVLKDMDRSLVARQNSGTIEINTNLLYYPNLLRWVVFNQLGQHYGLKLSAKDARHIMYDKIELNARNEYYAEVLRKAGAQDKLFFLRMEKIVPLELRI